MYDMSKFKKGQIVPSRWQHDGKRLVAVIGYGFNDWAAYEGPSDWTDERVAERGDKLAESMAKMAFPTVAHGRYYRV